VNNANDPRGFGMGLSDLYQPGPKPPTRPVRPFGVYDSETGVPNVMDSPDQDLLYSPRRDDALRYGM